MFWSLFLRALQGFTDFVQFLFQTKMIPSLSSIYQLLGFTEITSWCRKFSVTRSSEMFVQVRLLTYGQGTVASAKTLYFRTTLAHIKTAKQSFFCIGHSYDCVHSLNEKRVRLRRDASYLFIYLFVFEARSQESSVLAIRVFLRWFQVKTPNCLAAKFGFDSFIMTFLKISLF